LQARRFAQGKMEGNVGCLGEFVNLRNLIRAKDCGTLDHSEVPSELATTATPAPQSPEKRKPGAATDGQHTDSPPKKTKAGTGRVVEPFKQDIKKLLEQPRQDA